MLSVETVLRVPEGLANPQVRCTIGDDPVPCDVAPRSESGRCEVLIRFRYPVQLAGMLTLFVREAAVQTKKRGWLR